MEPREEILADGVSIWLGDCLEILPTLPNAAHIITDPPYEDELHKAAVGGRINEIRTDGRVTCSYLGFEGINKTREEVAKLITEKSDGWALIFSLAEGVRAWRDDLQKHGAKWDTTLAWIKPDSSPRFNGQGAARGFECIVTVWCGRGHRSWSGGGRRGVFEHCVNAARYGGHPTEKPVALMLDLVSLYTKPGEVILDPFMGSGTSGVACLKLGRKFIGIERDEKFFDLARKRLSESLSQPDMFVDIPKPKQVNFL